MSGFLDDAADSGLLSGLVGMGSGFIKGMENAEDRKYKRMEFEAKQKANDWEKEKKGLEAQIDQKKRGFDQANTLRDEWTTNQVTKKSQTIKGNLDKMRTAPNTGMGDITRVYNFISAQDPTTGIKEGEMALPGQAAGVSDKWISLYNNLIKGDRMSPNQRAELMRAAQQLEVAQRQSQTQFDKRYTDLASGYGLDPKNVIYQIWEDPQTGEQKVVPVPASAPNIQGPATESPGLVTKPRGLVKKPAGKKTAPANGAPDFDNMSEEELRKYLGQ